MNLAGKVAKTGLNGVKTGKRAQEGKMRRPDVRGNEYGLWAGFQRHFQKIAAIQPENGPSVRVEVADALQTRGKALRSFKGWQEDDIMHLARAAVFFVNGADFSAQDKAGFARGFAGQAQVFFQRKHAFARRLQRFGKVPDARAGCVKSPVPNRPTPLRLAHKSR